MKGKKTITEYKYPKAKHHIAKYSLSFFKKIYVRINKICYHKYGLEKSGEF